MSLNYPQKADKMIMQYPSNEYTYFKQSHPPPYRSERSQQMKEIKGAKPFRYIVQFNLQDDLPFFKHLARGQKILARKQREEAAREFVKRLGSEDLSSPHKLFSAKKSTLETRRAIRERRMQYLFKNRQSIINKSPKLERFIRVHMHKGRLEKAYAYERTETGAYGFTSHVVGSGGLKTAKIAVELISGELYVRTTAPRIRRPEDYNSDMSCLRREIDILSLFKGEKEFVQMLHSYLYTSKKGFRKRATMLEYCNGGDLEQLVNTEAMHPENRTEKERAQLKTIFHDILLGVVKMHKKGVIHRDIKPANIFLMKDKDGNFSAKIGDFSLSIFKDHEKISYGGSPAFMSPENIIIKGGLISYAVDYMEDYKNFKKNTESKKIR